MYLSASSLLLSVLAVLHDEPSRTTSVEHCHTGLQKSLRNPRSVHELDHGSIN